MNVNLKKLAVVTSFCASVAFSGIAFSAPFVVVITDGGEVLVNLANGNINYCAALTYTNGTPYGQCVRIGVISTASLSGNVQILAKGAVAFITNSATGLVVECSLMNSANNGTPYGTCISHQAQ